MVFLGRTVGLAVLLTVGCVAPFAPPNAYRFTPPSAYADAWAWVEDCSGLRGDMDRVQWHAVPSTVFECDGGRNCAGAWNPPHDIFLSEWSRDDSASFYRAVRHEILHDLLNGPPSGNEHPPVFAACGLM